MKIIYEGEIRTIGATLKRKTGSGTFDVTLPQRRILDANKAVITGFDWGGATWDATAQKVLASFDSTAAGLTALGVYYLQLRATVTPTGGAAEKYIIQIVVLVKDLGP